jgi:hypothetical protein
LHHAKRLHRVGVEQGAVCVRKVGERPHVVAEAILMRDPRHRHEPCPAIHRTREVIPRDAAIALLDDSQVDTTRRLEVPIQDERRVVVQLVDDDVVARLEIERGGDDVLAFTGGEEEPDLVRIGANESRELSADLVGLAPHLVERNRLRGFAISERARRFCDRPGRRRDVRRVQIQPLPDDVEIGANAEWILLVGVRTLCGRRLKGGSARHADELPPSEIHCAPPPAVRA